MKKNFSILLLFYCLKIFSTEVGTSINFVGKIGILNSFPMYVSNNFNNKNFDIKFEPGDIIIRVYTWAGVKDSILDGFPDYIPLKLFIKKDGSFYKEGDTILINRIVNDKTGNIKLKCLQQEINKLNFEDALTIFTDFYKKVIPIAYLLSDSDLFELNGNLQSISFENSSKIN